MEVHDLKTDPDVFKVSFEGNKQWEIRLNDRNFKVGDLLILRETESSGFIMRNCGASLVYTGRIIVQEITYILKGPIYGLEKDWVVMSVHAIYRGPDEY